ncbi:hypothetical protein ACLOJK_031128 [Asimina triloba]
MYVTRPLSAYSKAPQPVIEASPEGPILVIADEEYEAEARCCWGLCKDNGIRNPPFPQNKILIVQKIEHHGESTTVYRDKVYLIPVLDRPLASNRYYAIRASGKHKG